MNTAFDRNSDTGTETWLTPQWLIEDLGPFDLDPCAAPEPRPWPTAKRHITWPEDGLAADWGNDFVFCNPPYGRKTADWLRKMMYHDNGIALIFARTDTKQFSDWVWPHASAFLFLYGRVQFLRPDGSKGKNGPGSASMLIAYGPQARDRLFRNQDLGKFLLNS